MLYSPVWPLVGKGAQPVWTIYACAGLVADGSVVGVWVKHIAEGWEGICFGGKCIPCGVRGEVAFNVLKNTG